jgi:hypothetical protein
MMHVHVQDMPTLLAGVPNFIFCTRFRPFAADGADRPRGRHRSGPQLGVASVNVASSWRGRQRRDWLLRPVDSQPH